MNLSFAGCGFLGIYHVGVAVCFKKYAPHLLLDKISGASAGAIAACCLLCDMPLGTITRNVLKLSKEARKKTLGPFSPSFNVQRILLESLEKYLPNDAHVRVSGKLHISLTRVYDRRNVIVSQFHSRQDLLQALLASSFIPFFSGLLPPRFHGIRYMDGGFSDNLPTLDENTITISPFCGESDICPRDISSQLFHINFANTSIELSRQNIYRFTRILFPPNPETLSNMCKQGFDDALRFLERNKLINCTRCVAVQSTFLISETVDDNKDYDPECNECRIHRQEALMANLPETVMTIFQEAIDSANKGIINWLFRHKSIKFLSFLSLPYTIPIDVICATLKKIFINRPKFNNNLIEILKYLASHLYILLSKLNGSTTGFWQSLDFELFLTQYDSHIDINSIRGTELTISEEKNDEFTLTNSMMASYIIDMNEFVYAVDTFENALQTTSNQEALEIHYYLNNAHKKLQSQDISRTPNDEHLAIEVPTRCQDYFWNEQPACFLQHDQNQMTTFHNNEMLLNDEVHQQGEKKNVDKLSDISIEECNILSDTESEWAPVTTPMPSDVFLKADWRPEVDQPIPQ